MKRKGKHGYNMNKTKCAIKITVVIIIFLILIFIGIVGYFLLIDIESKVPENISREYNVKEETFLNRKVYIIKSKKNANNTKNILYFHGGAYMAEAMDYHWDFLTDIVDATNATIIFPDYPLSPKYNYKDVFSMIIPLYKRIIEDIKPEDIILMGDSAGGGMALGLVEELGKENIEMPGKTILISPWLDINLTNPKIDEVEKYDKDLSKEKLLLAGIAYSAGDNEEENYWVNSINGPLDKLKNVIIFTGTYDILNPDVHLLKEKAEKVGTNIEIKEYEGAEHIWLVKKNLTKSELAEKAFNDLLDILKER